MNRKDFIILKKILSYCVQCEDACKMFENNFDNFCKISVFQNACCMCVLQIGELCKSLSSEVRLPHLEVSWKGWCGIRDIFAHQYSNLDFEMAWDAIQNDLPVLKKAASEILNLQDVDT